MTNTETQRPRKREGFERRTQALRDQYISLAHEGLTTKEASERLGRAYSTVSLNARRFGVHFVYDQRGPYHDVGRTDDMISMYRDGLSLEDIGSSFGVSRERVRQILHKYAGMTAKDGGAYIKMAAKRAERRRMREEQSYERYGCSRADMRGLRDIGKDMMDKGHGYYSTPLGSFRSKRNNVIYNGGEWTLKVWEWWQVWVESGKWPEKGRGLGKYGMTRIDPAYGFVPGNVKIIKFGDWWGRRHESVSEARPGSFESIES